MTERRRFNRYPTGLTIEFNDISSQRQFQQGRLLNLSLTGACIYCKNNLIKSQVINLKIILDDEVFITSLDAKIIHTGTEREGVYIRVMFINPDPEKIVEIWQRLNLLEIKIKEEYIKSEGENIHLDIFEYDNHSPCLIFIHGIGAHTRIYIEFLCRLAARGFNIFGVDLRGHGKSSGKRGDFTYEQAVQDVQRVIEHIVANYNPHIGIIGTSLGSYFAYMVAAADNRIKRVLCHNILDPQTYSYLSLYLLVPLFKILPKINPNAYIDIAKLVNFKKLFNDTMFWEILKRDRLFVWHYSIRTINSFFQQSLKNKPLRVPVLILVGEKDEIITSAYCRRIFNYISGEKKFVEVPDAKHLLLVEYIPQILPIIEDWFRKF